MSALINAFMLCAAASGVASVAVPAARKFAFGSIKNDWMADEIDLDHIHRDGCTVFLKGGDFFRVIKVNGVAYDARPKPEVFGLSELRGEALGFCGDAGATVRLIAVKRRKDIHYDADWPTSSLTDIGEAEKARFSVSFDIHWHLIIQCDAYNKLVEVSDKVVGTLGAFGASVIEQAKKPETDDKDDFSVKCELTSFLHYLITGDWRDDLAPLSNNLSVALPGCDIDFNKDGIITTQVPCKRYSKMIGIRSWPETINGQVLGELISLTADIEICHVMVPIDQTVATALFRRKSSEVSGMSFFGGGAKGQEFALAVEELSERGSCIFNTQFILIVSDDSIEELDEIMRKASDIMAREQIGYNVETVSAAAMWFNRIPGRETLIRPLKLFNRNVGCIWPFHNAPSGNQSSPYGDRPVRIFGLDSGQAYKFQFHVKDEPQSKGHYLVLAPTGGGKTTLILHLLAGLTKFDGVRSYVFDSREGARYSIEAMGGKYYSYDNLELNPLDTEDTPASRERINNMIRSMLGANASDNGVDGIITSLLSNAFEVECPERTFNNLFKGSFKINTDLRDAFKKWVTVEGEDPGLHARIFNSKRDGLANVLDDSHIVGINMNEALSSDVLGPPVVAHICSAISNIAAKNAKGFNIFIDEGANLLRNKGFESAVQEMYREYRKLDGCVGMAFQDPSALFNCDAADAIIENIATLIIFPNSLAKDKDYERFNLNDEHMAFIKGNHKGRKVLIVRRDSASSFSESVIIDVDLAWLGKSMGYYRSGIDAIKHLETVQKEYPDDWMQRLV